MSLVTGISLTGKLKQCRLLFNCCLLAALFFFSVQTACKRKVKQTLTEKEIIVDKKDLNARVQAHLKDALETAIDSSGKISDSLHLKFYKVTAAYYELNNYEAIWSDTGQWKSFVPAFLNYFDTCIYHGLFKEDYHASQLWDIFNHLKVDSIAMMDAIEWTKADLLLTASFMNVLGDLTQGRLQHDSLSWQHDTSRYKRKFFNAITAFREGMPIAQLLDTIQPGHTEYQALRLAIRSFADSMDERRYTYINYPFRTKDSADSIRFVQELSQRLSEEDTSMLRLAMPDSLQLAQQIRIFNKRKGMTVDGRISADLIRRLNLTDKEKLIRIAITLDRYKQLPDSMPSQFVWVNLPGFYLKVVDSDTIALESRIVCGKPGTATPLLTGKISDMVIYPTWTVPQSIIKKEMLPALQKNSGYLAKKGLNLYNPNGDLVDPGTINWAKYSKGIPFKIQQGSGDDNALGVIKFNFKNPFDVYLHDTNQRSLFKKTSRALSHGCVRVQEWEKLAFFFVRNDSLRKLPDTLKYNTDSIRAWIAAKQKHRVAIANPIPLFIRYFSCESIDGKLRFYEDIYNEDKRIRDSYFAGTR